MNVGQLKAFADHRELFLEDGRRAKVTYKIRNGQGVLVFSALEEVIEADAIWEEEFIL